MNILLSLTQLLTKHISKAPTEIALLPDDDSSKKVGTTVRFRPDVKAFIDTNADHLGISAQEFVNLTLKAVMTASYEPQRTELQLAKARFFEVFQVHGIPVSDIASVLNQDTLKTSDLESSVLLDKITPELRGIIAELFNIDEDWLKGTDHDPLPCAGTWYKNAHHFAKQLALYNHRDLRPPRILFIAEEGAILEDLRQAKEKKDKIDPVNIGVVIERTRMKAGLQFNTYEVYKRERWNYEKCRYYLKAILLFCAKTSLHVDGLQVSKDMHHDLFYGKLLAASILNRRVTWHPDEFVWIDERNPELDELPQVAALYKEENMETLERAIKRSYEVTNWDEAERRPFEFLTVPE
ncbi:MAG: hypothetical protein MI976_11260 [Pseudomonadales bacterium]|nr:hypothetical protein [Pseudomonadales bacterium]